MLLCEAAGFDVVLVETVGVGQSEVKVAAMVDLFLVLVAPGGGDELQGLKRGIMELADLVVVNKADGALAATAAATASDYASALHLVRPRIPAWSPRVLTCSALLGAGIAEVWAVVDEFRAAVAPQLERLRAEQSREWMWSEVTESLLETLRRDARVDNLARRLEADVAAGTTTPTAAARAVVQAFLDLDQN
jgi:LAO/AO transport system kinase